MALSKATQNAVDQPTIHRLVMNYEHLLRQMEREKVIAREMIKLARKMSRVAVSMRKG